MTQKPKKSGQLAGAMAKPLKPMSRSVINSNSQPKKKTLG